MILIADGGSTKVDWVAIDYTGKELFRCRTQGLNPALLSKEALSSRVKHNFELNSKKSRVNKVYFYGAGCGTPEAEEKLKTVFQSIFNNADVAVAEDMLAAVYASSKGKEAIVCILGTGSNSCYYDTHKITSNVESLGYLLMDEASGNYFGKKLIRDFYYKNMPTDIAEDFAQKYDLSADEIKRNLYREESPNAYLGHFAEFMFDYTDHQYMHAFLKKGFSKFFEYRILPYQKYKEVPIYFIGSIAYFFAETLKEVAAKYELKITGILRRPIDDLVQYHREKLD